MHAERAPAGGDVGDDGPEVGKAFDHRLELVDDDHEPSEGHVVVELGDIARSGIDEHRLAVPELGAQARHGTLRLALVEVGDNARDLRQLSDRGERRASLEVDEQERHALRRVRVRERGEPREQEFALPASRGTRDECVRAVSDQVDLEAAAGHRSHGDGERRA